MRRIVHLLTLFSVLIATATCGWAQEASVNPGINDSFRDPDVKEFTERFEVESREVFARRSEIVAACQIETGMTVADIGAGTGLFTRLFADAVGKDGQVIAVDISQNFLDHIKRTSRELGIRNVETLLATADSTQLPEASVDVAFICDTYHHFEFPQKTMTSLYRAMKPRGRVILIDFRRIPGESTDWVLNHVRAGQEVFEEEIEQAGFRKVDVQPALLQENYFVVFRKPTAAEPTVGASKAESALVQQRPGRGPGRGMGRGMQRGGGRGPSADMRADQDAFHFLLEHHTDIRRTVKRLDDGVETLTESDKPEVARKIKEHVASMHQRVKEGRGLRFWDELFVAIFQRYPDITMTVERTDKGVRVRETSADPAVVALIQAHADVVSRFVELGFEEARKNHPIPKTPAAADKTPAASDKTPAAADKTPAASDGASRLAFPIIAGQGGVVARPAAAEQPQAGAKIVLDITAASDPAEVNAGLDRAARLLNLYGAAGLKSADVELVMVLHGDATAAALNDAAYRSRFGTKRNPSLPLIGLLQQAGAEVYICGQALNYKGFQDSDVADGIPIAAAAMTLVVNKQSQGFAYVPLR